MAEIRRVYQQSLPAMKLVGKRYGEADRENGGFGGKWSEWFEKGWFEPLKMPDTAEPFEDCDAYIGLCLCRAEGPFEYWIGVFLPEDFPVPEGYDSLPLKAGQIDVAWIYGKEPDIYSNCFLYTPREGCPVCVPDENGVRRCFERYVCPRFTEPDRQGNIILDMCYYVT